MVMAHSKAIKVIHLPPNMKNPYFPLLAKYLGEAGIEIDNRTGYLSLSMAFYQRTYYDLVHVHFLPERLYRFIGFILRLFVYRLAGIRVIKTCHNIRSHSGGSYWKDWQEKIFAHFVDHMIFFTEGQYQEYCEYYRFRPQSYSVIPHPKLDIFPNTTNRDTARSSFGIHAQDFVYLIFGAVLHFKNYDHAIEIFQKIRRPQDRLLLSIQPHPVNKIEQEAFERCKQLLEEDQEGIIAHIGYLEDDILQRYFNAADVILLPFEDNTSSTTFMLTLDFEIPFISIINSFNQYVLNEKCGIYIHSVNELQEAMIKIRNTDLKTMRQEIVKRKSLFCWKPMIEKHIEVYQLCLHK